MALERLERRSRCSVPEPHRPINRARDDLLAIGGEGDRSDRVSVALERLERRAPVCLHFWSELNPIWDTPLKIPSNNAIS
jgi:hypothetical protein